MTGECFYCGRSGDRPLEPLEPCCERHADDLVCADRAGCRDYLLAALEAAERPAPEGFGEWLGEGLPDYPLIADGSQERIYLRAAEARSLLDRAYTAGYALAGIAPEREPESGRLAAIIGVVEAVDETGDAITVLGDALTALEKIEQIAITSRVATGIDPGGQAVILPDDLVTVRQALADAIWYRAQSSDSATAGAYEALAGRIGGAR